MTTAISLLTIQHWEAFIAIIQRRGYTSAAECFKRAVYPEADMTKVLKALYSLVTEEPGDFVNSVRQSPHMVIQHYELNITEAHSVINLLPTFVPSIPPIDDEEDI